MQYSIRDSVQYQSGKSLETGDLVLVRDIFLTDCYMPAIVVHAEDTQLFVHYLDTPRKGDEWVDLPYPIPHGLKPIVKLDPGATNTRGTTLVSDQVGSFSCLSTHFVIANQFPQGCQDVDRIIPLKQVESLGFIHHYLCAHLTCN